MERCPKCAAELPAVANFCPICGTKLEEAAEPRTDLPEERFEPKYQASGAADAKPGQRPGTGEPTAEERAAQAASAPPGWRVAPVTGVQMLGPAAAAGVVGGVLVGVPGMNACACLWMLACGALAVFFFYKQFGRAPLPNEAGKLGVQSGFFGFLVGVLVSFVSFALIRRHPFGLLDALRDNMEQSAKLVKPDDAQRILEMMNSPAGSAMLVFTFAAVYFVGFLAFGTVGALLAGSVARRRE